MRRLLFSILSAVISLYGIANPVVQTGTQPVWLDMHHPDLDKRPDPRDINEGYYYQLLDRQINLLNNTEYHHYIKQIFNQSGIQNGSEVSVTFAPEFQHVVFHKIVLLREGQVINQLQQSQIKVVEEEKDADEFQYDGLKRAFITLKDVRKGDRIEASWSVIGQNPVFGNRFSKELYLNSETAICNFYTTILTSADRPLHISTVNHAPAPVEQHSGNTLLYRWDDLSIKSHDHPSSAPSWYNPLPTAYITEYNNWQEVIGWGLTTFNHYHYPLPAALRTRQAEWLRAAKGDKDLYANLATRFVQNEVRYLGLEMGVNTHQPHSPAEVYNQRFGDCKDKALLLTILLQQQGIPAYTALVNTDIRSQMNQAAPSPGDFDHAIVAIEKGNGSYRFIDPTIPNQRGEFPDLYVPDYGYALVLKEGLTSLQPASAGDIYDYFITETLQAPFFDTARYTITYTYKGGAADEERSAIAETSIKNLEKHSLSRYKDLFEDIHQDGPFALSDDSLKNEFTISKHYSIPELWSVKDGERAFNFSVAILSAEFSDPSDIAEDAPIKQSYPLHINYTLDLTLPEDWPACFNEIHIHNSSYQFDFTPSFNGNTMTLRYNFKTLRDYIPTSDIAQYKKDYKEIEEVLAFKLYKELSPEGISTTEEPTKSPANLTSPSSAADVKACWPAIWLTFFFALFFSRLFQYLNTRSEETLYAPGSGYPLGGWLLLLGVSLAIGGLLEVLQLYRSNYYSYANWAEYEKLGRSALPYLYLGKLSIQLSFIACTSAMLYWFLKRRDIFPRMFFWYAGILLTGRLLLVILFFQAHLPASLSTYRDNLTMDLARSTAYCAIWIVYLLRSGQVRSTFLEPY